MLVEWSDGTADIGLWTRRALIVGAERDITVVGISPSLRRVT